MGVLKSNKENSWERLICFQWVWRGHKSTRKWNTKELLTLRAEGPLQKQPVYLNSKCFNPTSILCPKETAPKHTLCVWLLWLLLYCILKQISFEYFSDAIFNKLCTSFFFFLSTFIFFLNRSPKNNQKRRKKVFDSVYLTRKISDLLKSINWNL